MYYNYTHTRDDIVKEFDVVKNHVVQRKVNGEQSFAYIS